MWHRSKRLIGLISSKIQPDPALLLYHSCLHSLSLSRQKRARGRAGERERIVSEQEREIKRERERYREG